MVGAWRFELQTSCAQCSCKKSISLVRLALFYVMVYGFGPNLAVVGLKLDPSFSLRSRRRQAGAWWASFRLVCVTRDFVRLDHHGPSRPMQGVSESAAPHVQHEASSQNQHHEQSEVNSYSPVSPARGAARSHRAPGRQTRHNKTI
jgi:hypothetical protein